VPEWTIGAAC